MRGSIDDCCDFDGTYLYVAATYGYASIIRKLLAADARIDLIVIPGNNLGPALYADIDDGRFECVRLLLAHGARTDIAGPRYKSAMELAKACQRTKTIAMLETHSITPPFTIEGLNRLLDDRSSIPLVDDNDNCSHDNSIDNPKSGQKSTSTDTSNTFLGYLISTAIASLSSDFVTKPEPQRAEIGPGSMGSVLTSTNGAEENRSTIEVNTICVEPIYSYV